MTVLLLAAAVAIAGIIAVIILNKGNKGSRLEQISGIVVLAAGCGASIVMYSCAASSPNTAAVIAAVILATVMLGAAGAAIPGMIRRRMGRKQRESRQREKGKGYTPPARQRRSTAAESGAVRIQRSAVQQEDRPTVQISPAKHAEPPLRRNAALDAAADGKEQRPQEDGAFSARRKEEQSAKPVPNTVSAGTGETRTAEKSGLPKPENMPPVPVAAITRPEKNMGEEQAKAGWVEPEAVIDRKQEEMDELKLLVSERKHGEALKKVFHILNAGYLLLPEEKRKLMAILALLKEYSK